MQRNKEETRHVDNRVKQLLCVRLHEVLLRENWQVIKNTSLHPGQLAGWC